MRGVDVSVSRTCFRRSVCVSVHMKSRKGKMFVPGCFIVPGLLLFNLTFLLLPGSSLAYYVGPEVGNAPGETRVVKTRGFGFGFPNNATSLAEAAYVPQVYAVGGNIVTFLRSVIPALQPKVDFFAEQIQDTIDIANEKLMQKLENSNNGIIAVENFFKGLMRAVVLGKGPSEEEERRRNLAMAFIRSGMLDVVPISPATTTSTTTKRPTTATTTGASTTKRSTTSTVSTTTAGTRKTTRASPTTGTTGSTTTTTTTTTATTSTTTSPPPSQKARDNIYSKMKVVNIVKNLL